MKTFDSRLQQTGNVGEYPKIQYANSKYHFFLA